MEPYHHLFKKEKQRRITIPYNRYMYTVLCNVIEKGLPSRLVLHELRCKNSTSYFNFFLSVAWIICKKEHGRERERRASWVYALEYFIHGASSPLPSPLYEVKYQLSLDLFKIYIATYVAHLGTFIQLSKPFCICDTDRVMVLIGESVLLSYTASLKCSTNCEGRPQVWDRWGAHLTWQTELHSENQSIDRSENV